MSLCSDIYAATEALTNPAEELREVDSGVRWRDVPGTDGRFRVSELGKVACRGQLVTDDLTDEVWLSYDKRYWRVNPGVLVLLAFVGPRPEGCECCHRDDNHRNNQLSNVRWDTRQNNVLDSIANGGRAHQIGELANASKLTEVQVKEAILLRALQSRIWTYAVLGERYGVHPSTVHKAVTGQNWSHLRGAL